MEALALREVVVPPWRYRFRCNRHRQVWPWIPRPGTLPFLWSNRSFDLVAHDFGRLHGRYQTSISLGRRRKEERRNTGVRHGDKCRLCVARKAVLAKRRPTRRLPLEVGVHTHEVDAGTAHESLENRIHVVGSLQGHDRESSPVPAAREQAKSAST